MNSVLKRLRAVALWENLDLFYKLMQTSSYWQCFGVVTQFLENISALLLVHTGFICKYMCGHEAAHCCVFHISNSGYLGRAQ